MHTHCIVHEHSVSFQGNIVPSSQKPPSLFAKNLDSHFAQASFESNLTPPRAFAMNRDIWKLIGAMSRVYGGCDKTSHSSFRSFWRVIIKCVVWLYPGGILYPSFWPILDASGRSPASSSPVVRSRWQNQASCHTGGAYSGFFPSNSNTHTAKPI